MRIENGKEIYEEGDFDNALFYALLGTIFFGLPLALAYDNGDMALAGGGIGGGIYLLRWIIGKWLGGTYE